MRTCRRLLGHARCYRGRLVALFVLNFLAMPLTLVSPLPLKIAVDSALGGRPAPSLLRAVLPSSAESGSGLLIVCALLLLAAAVATELQRVASSVAGAYLGERLELDFRSEVFRHAQRLSIAYHDRRGPTDTLYRIFTDAPAIQWIGVYGVGPLVAAALTVVGMIVVTARIDLGLAAVALAVAPALIVLPRLFRTRLRTGWIRVKELDTASFVAIQESLSSLRVVKTFNRESDRLERFREPSSERLRQHTRVLAREGALRLGIVACTAAGTAGVLFVGIRGVQAGDLTLGDLLLVLGYLAQLYGPLETLSQSAAALQSSLASAERVFAVLDQTPEVPQATRPRRLDRARGAIAFDNVSFGYERGEQLLDRVSFELPAGSCLGIAGPTGIGKTTLVSLLPRLHDPLSGRVLLDGHDVRDYRLDDLRRQFAFVFQDPAIFAGTVAENVALGASSARGDEIDAALAAASASTLVARLPHGRDTILGERGLHLSAGERQRLALARAFVRNSPVLVLDEPTNSLDPATEAAILATLDELSGRRTTIMVAHRLVTLRMCDLVLELANDGTATLIRDVAGWLAEHQRGFPQQLHATA